MKLSPAQLRVLKRLGREPDNYLRAWGAGFGISRLSVRALSHRGLITYDEAAKGGVCCAITDAGRRALQDTGEKP